LKVLYLGYVFNESEEKDLLQKSKIGLPGAVNTYQWGLIKGLDKNLKKPVDIINLLPVGTYPKYFNDLVVRTREWSHFPGAKDLEIGFLNLPALKYIIQTLACKKAIKKWINDNANNDKIVVIYTPYLPFLLAAKSIPSNVTVTLVVTDMPEFYDLTASSNQIKKLLRIGKNFFIYKSMERINSFVLLTEQMKKPLNVGERPWVLIEGLVDNDHKYYWNKEIKKDKKIILYTGTLNFQYGILDLINGFRLIKKKDYELWICGSGEAEGEIIGASKADDRVKFFGYVAKKEIFELQSKATLLINPRTNDGKYTKYSFPSKTMEYMLSGRPVLMYKLDGIPCEYDQYLYYINGNSPKNLANRIMEVCEKAQSELDEFGEKARRFVMDNKNNIVQAKKIIDMMKLL